MGYMLPQRKLVDTSTNYKKGYHRGDLSGLPGVEPDLTAAHIMYGITVFGIVGTQVQWIYDLLAEQSVGYLTIPQPEIDLTVEEDHSGGGQTEILSLTVPCPSCAESASNSMLVLDTCAVSWSEYVNPEVTVTTMAVTNKAGTNATNRASTQAAAYTCINTANPVDRNGTIDTVKIWAATDLAGCKVGIFRLVSGTTYKCIDTESIGAVTAGAERTFAGLSLTAAIGDFIGIYFTSGTLEADTTGGTTFTRSGDSCVIDDSSSYSTSTKILSLGGTGVTSYTCNNFAMTDLAAVGRIATQSCASKDASSYKYVKFWIWSDVAINDGDLQMQLDDTAECISPVEELNLGAITASTWTQKNLALANPASDMAIISYDLSMDIDKGVCNIRIDNIRFTEGG